MSLRRLLSGLLLGSSAPRAVAIPRAVRSVIQQLESRTLLTSVSAIEFDYGVTPHAIRVTFDGPISPTSLLPDDLFVRKIGSDLSRLATSSFSSAVNASNTVATFTYNPGPFPDGEYIVDMFKADVLDAQGQPLTVDASSSFFFLYGDLSGPSGSRDRMIDTNDSAYVQSRIGTTNPTYGDGDLDEDDAVTMNDKYFVMDYHGSKLITPVDGLEGLTATPTNGTNVRLTWARMSTTNTGFRIQRSIDGGRTFTTIASSLAATSETFVDTTANLASNSYVYRVRSVEPNQAFSSIATPSRYVNAAIAQNASPGSSPIVAPQNPNVIAVSKNTLTLAWEDISTDERGFQIYRSDDGGLSYRSIKYLQVANATSWTDSNLKAQKTYFYVVRTRSDTATSGYSDVVSATTLSGAPTVIGADVPAIGLPQEIVAEFDQPITRNVAALTEAHVAVYSLTGGRQLIGGPNGEFTIVDSTDGELIRARFNGLLSGYGILTNGNYEIAVRGDAIRNDAGQTISDAEQPDVEGIATTFFLRADFNRDRVVSYDDLLILSQNYNQTNKTHAQGDTDFDGDTDFNDLLYLTQVYQVSLPQPLSSVSELSVTTSVFADLDFDPQHRSTPSDAAFLEWTAPSELEGTFDGYKVWRSIDSVNFGDPIATLPLTELNYIDRGLSEGERYTYRVRPFRNVGASIEYGTSTNKAGVATTLRGPSYVSVESTDSDSLQVRWTDNSMNESEYRVLVFDSANVLVNSITVGPNITSAVVSGLEEATAYSVRVSAWTPAATTHAMAEVTTRIAAPTDVDWAQLTSSSYELTWQDNSAHEAGYTVRWFADSGFEDGLGNTIAAGSLIDQATVSAGAGVDSELSFTLTGLPDDADVIFDVTATSASESSVSLTTESVSTLARVATPRKVANVRASSLALGGTIATDLDPYKLKHDEIKINWADSQSNVSHYYVWMTYPQRALLGVVKSRVVKGTAKASSSYQSVSAVASEALGPMTSGAAFGRAGYEFLATGLDPTQSYKFAVQPEFYDTAVAEESQSDPASTGIQHSGESIELWVSARAGASKGNRVDLEWNPIHNASARLELLQQDFIRVDHGSNPPTWLSDGEPHVIRTFGGSSAKCTIDALREGWKYRFSLRVIYHNDRYINTGEVEVDTPLDSEEDKTARQESDDELARLSLLTTEQLDAESKSMYGSLRVERNRGLGWYFVFHGPNEYYDAPDVNPADEEETVQTRVRFHDAYNNVVLSLTSYPELASDLSNNPPSERKHQVESHRVPSADPRDNLTNLTFTYSPPTAEAGTSSLAYWEEDVMKDGVFWTMNGWMSLPLVVQDSEGTAMGGGSHFLNPGSVLRFTQRSYGLTQDYNEISDNGLAVVENFTAPEYRIMHSSDLEESSFEGYAEDDAPPDDHDDNDENNDELHSPRPSDLEVVEVTDTTATLYLRDNAKNEQGIEIERSRDGVHWARVAVLTNRSADTSRDIQIVDSRLSPGVEYSYRARAFKWVTTTAIEEMPVLEFTRWSSSADGQTLSRIGVFNDSTAIYEGSVAMAEVVAYALGESLSNLAQVFIQIGDDDETDEVDQNDFIVYDENDFEQPAADLVSLSLSMRSHVKTVAKVQARVIPDERFERMESIALEVLESDDWSEENPAYRTGYLPLESLNPVEIDDADLAVDSDNDDGQNTPTQSGAEQSEEGLVGKILTVNDGDADDDRIPDYVDLAGLNWLQSPPSVAIYGETVPAKLYPVVIEVPGSLKTAEMTKVKLSLPSGVYAPVAQTLDDPSGDIRLWTKRREYVSLNHEYSLFELGAPAKGRRVILWAEALNPSSDLALRYMYKLERPTGDEWLLGDEVRLTSIALRTAADLDRDLDITFAIADRATKNKPHLFWTNANRDAWGGDDYQAAKDEVLAAGDLTTDASTPELGTYNLSATTEANREVFQRDLEDLSSIALRWSQSAISVADEVRFTLVSDDGLELRLFPLDASTASSEGTIRADAHLTNEETLYDAWGNFGGFTPGEQGIAFDHTAGMTLTLDKTEFLDWDNYPRFGVGDDDLLYIAVEGIHVGSGKLKFELLRGSKVIADTELELKSRQIKDLYDHYSVAMPGGNIAADGTYSGTNPLDDIDPVSTTATMAWENEERSRFSGDYFLFVHGWRMIRQERVAFAESAFKRMYWSGYKGQFGLFSWPTQYVENPVTDPGHFDRSEFIAWNSAAGLRDVVAKVRMGSLGANGKLNLMAHSLGGIVIAEAMNSMPVGSIDNAVFSNAAVSSHYFGDQSNIALYEDNVDAELFQRKMSSTMTDGWYYNGMPLNAIGGANPRFHSFEESVRRVVNFYNQVDYALTLWRLDQTFKPWRSTSIFDNVFWSENAPNYPELPDSWLSQALSGSRVAFSSSTTRSFGFGGTTYLGSPTPLTIGGMWYEDDDTAEGPYNYFYRGTAVQLPTNEWAVHVDSQLTWMRLYELLAFCAGSVASPIGQNRNILGNGVGPFTFGVNLQLESSKFNSTRPGHSAAFVHSFSDIKGYWSRLMEEFGK